MNRKPRTCPCCGLATCSDPMECGQVIYAESRARKSARSRAWVLVLS